MFKNLLYVVAAVLLTGAVFYLLLKNAGACTKLEDAATKEIEEANYCLEQSDCRAISFGCAFGCESLVNKERLASLRSIISSYNETCLMICPDNCPRAQSPLACLQGRCVRL
jgi:hypothetical protein